MALPLPLNKENQKAKEKMEKKIYSKPETEVLEICVEKNILEASPYIFEPEQNPGEGGYTPL